MRIQWKRYFVLFLVCAIAFSLSIAFSQVLAVSNSQSSHPHNSPTYNWDTPPWMPKPIVPADNPMTAAKVELGRHLFYEKRLSMTGEFSCASCHIQALAFTDGKSVSVGVTGEKHPRSSMSLANIGYNSVLTWAHPGMTKLEVQALIPMFGERPVEMGLSGKEKDFLTKLQQDEKYRQLFAAAFGEGNPTSLNSNKSSKTNSKKINPKKNNSQKNNPDNNIINIKNITQALASFQRSLISVNSDYDKYRYGGDKNAISASAKRGEVLFNSERLECFHCHGGLNFSDSIKHERLAFEEIAFHNTGLYNIDGKGAYPPNNTGIQEITHKPTDMGKFKAPTLRNIALTAPYMHDGSIATLGEVIDHYAAGGRTITSGEFAGVGSKNPLKSNFISGFKLTPQEKQDLIEFLKTLTDTEFVTNPKFSDPNLALSN